MERCKSLVSLNYNPIFCEGLLQLFAMEKVGFHINNGLLCGVWQKISGQDFLPSNDSKATHIGIDTRTYMERATISLALFCYFNHEKT